jgi:hypothetical protein
MKTIAWAVVGFVVGFAAASAIFIFDLAPWRTDALFAQGGQGGPTAADTEPYPVMNNDPLGELDVDQRIAMMRWMAANPQYEFITRDYCGCHDYPDTNCPEHRAERVGVLSDYPYTSMQDFNGDRINDVAIILGVKGKEGPQVLLIFNGPFGDAAPTPAFRADGLQRNDHVSGDFVGPPESDNGYSIKAKGATYELEYQGDPE